MEDNKTLKEQLDEASTEALNAAEAFCKALSALGAIEIKAATTEEEAKEIQEFLFERDKRCSVILRRVLIEYGNFLFV